MFISNTIFLQVQWQSEQERQESKSIYSSEKDQSLNPFPTKPTTDNLAGA